jgi:rhodanese-related sulfurtransferase
MSVTTISPWQLADLCKNGQVELIDVRTPVEYRELHVAAARNVPLDKLNPAALMQARNGSRNQPLYLICRSGSRGRQACEKFLAAGSSSTSRVAPWRVSNAACPSSEARRRCRWSGRFE